MCELIIYNCRSDLDLDVGKGSVRIISFVYDSYVVYLNNVRVSEIEYSLQKQYLPNFICELREIFKDVNN